MSIPLTSYLIYLGLSLVLTFWVARTLHKNGAVFLVEVFQGDESLARSVNHMLVVGFYLLNLGYISLVMKVVEHARDWTSAAETLSSKLGLVLLVLGGLHMFNLFVLNKIRRGRAIENRARKRVDAVT